MQSRRDQVEAYSYTTGRLNAALVCGEPDTGERPHQRVVVSVTASVLLGLLIAAGFLIYGFVVPGASTGWRTPGTLVVEKETGARYLFDGVALRPVLNYTSARLALGKAPTIAYVSASALRGLPVGGPVGIAGAPESLPASAAGDYWTVCAPPAGGKSTVDTTLSIAALPDPAGTTPLSGDRAVLVSAKDGTRHLIWRGRRHRIATDWVARVLGYDGDSQPVSDTWLGLVPPGSDLAAPSIAGLGEPGPQVDGKPTRIGEIFAAPAAGGSRFYVLQRDGLSPLSDTAYPIVAGDPAAAAARGGGTGPVELSPAAKVSLPVSAARVLPDDLPPVPPMIANPGAGQAWCVRTAVTTGRADIVAAAPPPVGSPQPGGNAVLRTSRTVAGVSVAAGAGGLVSPDGTGTAYSAISDAGVRYPLASRDVLTALGYTPSSALVVPPALLELLPVGPLLDPARAAAG
ncbi:type VII secretion protein EccB [Dactylosporangium sp. CA-092794]|uniref:type VII secretion protein EccB n=1 Tax=Dactylosporangium sp. CA-092794 TaxID=3239929 RepID=UPI003D949181